MSAEIPTAQRAAHSPVRLSLVRRHLEGLLSCSASVDIQPLLWPVFWGMQ